MDKRDYYEVLSLSKGATEAEIKKAYRRLAKQFHPDQNKGDKLSEQRFKELQEAYSVLSDKEKRSRYDQFGHAGVDPRYAGGAPGGFTWTANEGGPVDFGDLGDLFGVGRGESPAGGSIFEQLFSGRGRGSARGGEHAPSRAVEQEITLDFDQAIRGTTLELTLSGPHSRERISVHVPPGVRDGQTIRVRGKGRLGSRGGAPGDLHVICRVRPHPYFRREENDVYLDVPITLSEAALGAKVDLPTLDGVRTVTIPPGTCSGAKLRLTGLGVPSPKDGKRGDQFAMIKIVPPAIPTTEQRRLLEELSRQEHVSPRDGLWP